MDSFTLCSIHCVIHSVYNIKYIRLVCGSLKNNFNTYSGYIKQKLVKKNWTSGKKGSRDRL